MNSINTLPFLIHTPDLENQAPDEERGLIPSSPEGHLMKCIVAIEAEAGQRLRGVGPELAPRDHPPRKDSRMALGQCPIPISPAWFPASPGALTFTSGTKITN